jgi:hypothetical protein
MEPIPLPVIPVGDVDNTALAILPDVQVDKLETVSFELEDDCLRITCRYPEGHEKDRTIYPVKITESNRDVVQSMEKIAVMDPDQIDPQDLTDHPEELDKLHRLMEEINESPGVSPDDFLEETAPQDRVNGQ